MTSRDRPVAQLSYEEASSELDTIVDELEKGSVSVDDLVGRLERAKEIVEELASRISRSRAQVEKLVPDLLGAAQAAHGSASPSSGTDTSGDRGSQESVSQYPGGLEDGYGEDEEGGYEEEGDPLLF